MQKEMDNQLYDIYEQWHRPFWQTDLFFWSAVVIAIGFVVIVLYALYCRYIRRTKIEPYWVKTKKALDALSMSDSNRAARADFFYAQLIAILKDYFTGYFSRDFTSKTDRETVDLLNALYHDSAVCAVVQDIFETTLTIRFARDKAIEENMRADLQNAYALIERMHIQKESSQGKNSLK